MATTTALQGIPVPDPSDADNVPYWLSQVAQAVEQRLVMRWTSSTTRDAALPAPADGQLSALTTPGQLQWRRAGGWVDVVPVWQAYSPGLTANMTIGNGTVAARYAAINKTIFVQCKLTVGSTSGFAAGTLGINLPVAPAANSATDVLGSCFLVDSSAGSTSRTPGIVSLTGSGGGTAYFVVPAGTVTNTTPWSWAVGDTLSFNISYEAA